MRKTEVPGEKPSKSDRDHIAHASPGFDPGSTEVGDAIDDRYANLTPMPLRYEIVFTDCRLQLLSTNSNHMETWHYL